jgi:hypothetical protein
MRRRHFLKMLGLAFGGGAVALAIPWTPVAAESEAVTYRGKLYKGDQLGRVLVSADAGRTWKVQTSLGRIYSVKSLSVSPGQRLYATVAHRHRQFVLVLDHDGRAWRTV